MNFNLKTFAIIFSLIGVILYGQAPAAEGKENSVEHKYSDLSLYSISVYDTLGDPYNDLKITIKRAQKEEKRILLEVGGDWCRWCHILDKFIHEHESVALALGDDFIIMKVNYSRENKNEAFLKEYPEIPGFPHLFVLEKDGKFLHSQGTAVLEKEGSYSEETFLTFLKKWSPSNNQ